MSVKPTAQGTLAKTPFAHLLGYMFERKLSGTLAIWPELGAESGRGQDRLLLSEGHISAVRSLDGHTTALSAVAALFARSDGPYAFYADQNLLGAGAGVLHEHVDARTALARGLRDHPSLAARDAVVARMQGRTLRLREGFQAERLELSREAGALVERLREASLGVDEVVRAEGLTRDQAHGLIYLLTLVRGLDSGESAVTGPPSDAPATTAPSEPESARERPAVADSVSPPPPVRHVPAAPPPASAPPAPIGLSPLDTMRWTELTRVYQKLDEQTHYQLLALAPAATTAEVSSAYFALVKKFHPDRLPLALAPLLRCAQVVFERLTEAHDTLSQPAPRAAYDEAVAGGGGTRAAERMMRNVIDSAFDFQKAEVLLKRRDLAQAMIHLKTALQKNPDEPDYLALSGWLLHLMNPSETAPFDEMLALIDRALKAHPRSERAHYYRGVILKRMKRDREALHHFRAAVEINPRNVDAAREVRLAAIRRDSKPPPGASRLLSKIFKGPKT